MPDTGLTLAFDTSAAHCSVALVCGDTALHSRTVPMPTGQAERLFEMLESALSEAGKTWTDLSAIAVATGPGNFTGVRIAVSAARGLSLSLEIPAIGVSVLQALAAPVTGLALVTLDARRDRLLAQYFRDGAPRGAAEMLTWEALTSRQKDTALSCVGYRSDAIAAALTAKAGGEGTIADPVQIAFCAQEPSADEAQRPAPIYLRSPDAALPSEPPPVILHDA